MFLNRCYAVILLLVVVLQFGCASLHIGREFEQRPETSIRVGYHTVTDVEALMGQPYRKAVDGQGRQVYTYLWADGRGSGEKCIVAFNKNDIVYLVEVSP